MTANFTSDATLTNAFPIGVLVQCDASIKAIICNIDDQAKHDFIIEDLDDETVFVKTDKLDELKRRLQDVSDPVSDLHSAF